MDININIEEVEHLITGIISTLNMNQGEIDTAYDNLGNSFFESSGEEADALREQQQAERAMISEMSTAFGQLAKSIQTAAESFRELDRTGAKSMY